MPFVMFVVDTNIKFKLHIGMEIHLLDEIRKKCQKWRKFEIEICLFKFLSLVSNAVFVQCSGVKRDVGESFIYVNLLVICSSSNKLISRVRNFISYVISSSFFFCTFLTSSVYAFFACQFSSESKRAYGWKMEVPVLLLLNAQIIIS